MAQKPLFLHFAEMQTLQKSGFLAITFEPEMLDGQTFQFFTNLKKKTSSIFSGFEQPSSSIGWRDMVVQSNAKVAHSGLRLRRCYAFTNNLLLGQATIC